jgi:hypothetical protein
MHLTTGSSVNFFMLFAFGGKIFQLFGTIIGSLLTMIH